MKIICIEAKKVIGTSVAETVVLLSDKKVDGHINIDLDVEKLEDKSVASK